MIEFTDQRRIMLSRSHLRDCDGVYFEFGCAWLTQCTKITRLIFF